MLLDSLRHFLFDSAVCTDSCLTKTRSGHPRFTRAATHKLFSVACGRVLVRGKARRRHPAVHAPHGLHDAEHLARDDQIRLEATQNQGDDNQQDCDNYQVLQLIPCRALRAWASWVCRLASDGLAASTSRSDASVRSASSSWLMLMSAAARFCNVAG